MTAWAELLVPAGSGLIDAMVGGGVTFLVTRAQVLAAQVAQASSWAREDREKRLRDYADLAAVASEIMASWADLLTPRPAEEIQGLDDERQVLYAGCTNSSP